MKSLSLCQTARLISVLSALAAVPPALAQPPTATPLQSTPLGTTPPQAHPADVRALYTKSEFTIRMRDGVRLYTVVFMPKDTTKTYPILLTRTPYGVPTGANNFPNKVGPSSLFTTSGYIVAYQSVRGTHLSEGTFVNVRPLLSAHRAPKATDESTDAYDTIEYLVKNIPGSTRRVGMWGTSYAGFYADAGAICGHPALAAVSPQAPLTDWFLGDDDHHNGAFYLMDNFEWDWMSNFDLPRTALTQRAPHPHHAFPSSDAYQFYLDMGPLKNANDKYLKRTIPFWNEMMDHPNYDAYWQARNLNPHLVGIKPALLITGGWFDAEDFAGTLATYASVGRQSPATQRFLVIGPWQHGGWERGSGQRFGDLDFGSATAVHYREAVEFPFFEYYLKGIGAAPAVSARAQVFDTGTNQWLAFGAWPPHRTQECLLYLAANHSLAFTPPGNIPLAADSYTSDPANPVPYSAHAHTQIERYTPYMAEDQRFVDARPDVLTYHSPALTEDIAAAGPIDIDLYTSTTTTDTDFVVKVIDLYPPAPPASSRADLKLAGSEILIRADVMRGRFRNSFENPAPFSPGAVTLVKFPLPDICHTFRKGHRIAVQIQSSWFPLVDRNPQTFVDINRADQKDFQKAEVRVWRSGTQASRIVLQILPITTTDAYKPKSNAPSEPLLKASTGLLPQ